MAKVSRPRKDFLRADKSRQDYIVNQWFLQVVTQNNLETNLFKIKSLLSTGAIGGALDELKQLLLFVVSNANSLPFQDGDVLGYLIGENIKYYGIDKITRWFFHKLYKIRIRKDKPIKRVSKKDLKELEDKELDKVPVRKPQEDREFFGFNKQNKKESGNVVVKVDSKGNIKFLLKSTTTGQFLTHSDTFKKELQQRRKEAREGVKNDES